MGPDQFSFVVDYLPKTGNAVAGPTSNQDHRPESAGPGACILTSGEERSCYKRNRKCLYIPQNINCAAPTSNQDHWPESVGTFPLADAFLLLTSSHPKTEEKNFYKRDKKIPEFHKIPTLLLLLPISNTLSHNDGTFLHFHIKRRERKML